MNYLLLLSGGAAKGAFQVPIIERLIVEKGYPSHVVGTSIGSGNATAVASGKVHILRKLWKIDSVRAFQSINLDIWHGLNSLNKYRKIIEEHDVLDFDYCKISVGLVDLATGNHRTICLNNLSKEDKLDALIASASQPMIHERAQFRNRWCVDGGVKAVVPPIKQYLDYDEIHVVTCFPLNPKRNEVPQEELTSATAQVFQAVDIFVNSVMYNDIQRLRTWVSNGAKVYMYCPPSWEAIGTSWEASEKIITQRLELGYEIAKQPILLTS
jgi:predicted acylesterase/phospholipase RssA